MALSVIIPNWNGELHLHECIPSILRQTMAAFELIVVDNGSTDSSLTYLSQCSDFRLRVLQLSENFGFSYAVNRGVETACGELVLVLNNDTVIDPQCFAVLIDAAGNYPNIGFFAPAILQYGTDSALYAAGLMFSERGYGNRSQRYALASVSQPTEVFGACGAAALYRQSVLEVVGLFNEDFFVLSEDTELSFRHQLKGYRCLYIPSAIVIHKGSATLRKIFGFAAEQGIRNALYVLFTCVPSDQWRRKWFVICRTYCKLLWLLSVNGYYRAVNRALFYCITHARYLYKRRRHLQQGARPNGQRLATLLYKGPIEVNLPTKSLWV